MKKVVTLAVYFGFQAVLLAFLASWAFGAPDVSMGDHHRVTDPSLVTVQGKLICDLGSQNTGQPCALQLEEDGTGRVYRLGGSESAMRLYFEGTRRAAIEGRRSNDATYISVKRATAL